MSRIPLNVMDDVDAQCENMYQTVGELQSTQKTRRGVGFWPLDWPKPWGKQLVVDDQFYAGGAKPCDCLKKKAQAAASAANAGWCTCVNTSTSGILGNCYPCPTGENCPVNNGMTVFEKLKSGFRKSIEGTVIGAAVGQSLYKLMSGSGSGVAEFLARKLYYDKIELSAAVLYDTNELADVLSIVLSDSAPDIETSMWRRPNYDFAKNEFKNDVDFTDAQDQAGTIPQGTKLVSIQLGDRIMPMASATGTIDAAALRLFLFGDATAFSSSGADAPGPVVLVFGPWASVLLDEAAEGAQPLWDVLTQENYDGEKQEFLEDVTFVVDSAGTTATIPKGSLLKSVVNGTVVQKFGDDALGDGDGSRLRMQQGTSFRARLHKHEQAVKRARRLPWKPVFTKATGLLKELSSTQLAELDAYLEKFGQWHANSSHPSSTFKSTTRADVEKVLSKKYAVSWKKFESKATDLNDTFVEEKFPANFFEQLESALATATGHPEKVGSHPECHDYCFPYNPNSWPGMLYDDEEQYHNCHCCVDVPGFHCSLTATQSPSRAPTHQATDQPTTDQPSAAPPVVDVVVADPISIVYLDGSWAELFQQHISAWQENTPTQEEVEDTLERYAELAQNPVIVH